ncbi:glycosyl transferase family 2 [Thermaurantimonas aggregans]|uniref:Glycosyl transferase family 2 n=1 Tax=Thermaurantimonas aggregans TaxID=2173829 RepID=A0A401XIY8_9FLAO|nr:glycosyltransferase [Thermaurantimonas aggregans]MCX8148995.1 glycosyltransferase [Thermaurantimonas aggregans]GCD76989.1 glycosyl transferase family 2 [Thermaurantimonas aggregans]
MITTAEWWVLTVVMAPALLFQWYLFYAFFTAQKRLNKSNVHQNLPVSLIVCARNELENLQKNLPKWVSQKYPELEVIVVNDRSWDDSRFYLEEQASQHSNLKIVTVPDNDNYWAGKKLALTLGIKAAKHDIVLLTDADCAPASEYWVQHMMKGYTDPSVEIVLGYGRYQNEKGLLNLIIRMETLHTAWQYLTAAWAGWPFMGVGRNLSYRKELFFKNKGFYKHMHIASGDDDLFINEVATRQNTQVVIHPEAVTVSIPKKTWAEYIYQRRRHFSTSSHYRTGSKIFLASYQVSRLVIWTVTVLSLALLSMGNTWFAIPFGLGTAYFVKRWWALIKLGKLGGEGKLGWWYPVLSAIIFAVQLRIWLQNVIIGVPKGWKKT